MCGLLPARRDTCLTRLQIGLRWRKSHAVSLLVGDDADVRPLQVPEGLPIAR